MDIGAELTSRVTSLSYGGEGVIKYQDITGFIYGALTGELVKSRIIEIKKNYFRSKLLEILEPSPFRITPKCPYFNHCGGCVYQHLIYEKQLETKTSQLQELLQHIGKIPELKITRVIPSPAIFNYRNQLTLKLNRGQLGFIGIDNKTFVPIEKCLIAKEAINNKIPKIKNELAKGSRIKKLKGEIIIKCGADNTVDYAFSESISTGGDYKLLYEKIDDKIYYFSLATFFQVNPYILPFILSELKDTLNLNPPTVLSDLYSGTGLFSIYLSSSVKNAYGIEENKSAIKLAQKSAEKNNIKNCRFFEGKVENTFLEIYEKQKGDRNVFIVDPPRQGLSKDMLNYLKDYPSNQLVYISCEPAKLARDLNFLYKNGYKINNLIVTDMFPQTKHMETIAILAQHTKLNLF